MVGGVGAVVVGGVGAVVVGVGGGGVVVVGGVGAVTVVVGGVVAAKVGVGVGVVVVVAVAVAVGVGVGVAMKAADFLAQTQAIVRERGEQYGDARTNMADTARRWSGVLGVPVTPAQVAVMMIELKLSRMKTGIGLDSVADIAGYAAILAELTTD